MTLLLLLKEIQALGKCDGRVRCTRLQLPGMDNLMMMMMIIVMPVICAGITDCSTSVPDAAIAREYRKPPIIISLRKICSQGHRPISDIAKLCSNLLGTGKTKQKIIEGLLVNLNFFAARTCVVKQSEIQELSPSVCTLPSRGPCHFFEAGSILMGRTPEDDVNL
ncbi:hypothetical protein BTVI_74563 [Pitangus sulphuratus]|nr:hypothetical protein BTVI_74563 [Pitangus sulphuratus]